MFSKKFKTQDCNLFQLVQQGMHRLSSKLNYCFKLIKQENILNIDVERLNNSQGHLQAENKVKKIKDDLTVPVSQ
jgi:uncharacterized protein YijF (DUF1287 family)